MSFAFENIQRMVAERAYEYDVCGEVTPAGQIMWRTFHVGIGEWLMFPQCFDCSRTERRAAKVLDALRVELSKKWLKAHGIVY